MNKNVVYFYGYKDDNEQKLYIDLTDATLSDLVFIDSDLKNNFSETSLVVEDIILKYIDSHYKKMNNKIKKRKKTNRRFRQKMEGK